MARFVSLAAIAAFLFATSTAHAQADHLQCFKIKDSLARKLYQADLVPSDNNFASSANCTVIVPAKLLCIDVQKTNVTPTPPGSAAGLSGQKYLCYKVKCTTPQPATAMQDQFGSHSLVLKSTSLFCAPEPAQTCVDSDGDGYLPAPCGSDCDDTSATVYPGAPEVCNNIDDNCDGNVDEGLGSISCGTGQCQNTVAACLNGAPNSCTPGNPSVEVCDNVDNNCNGMVDDGLGSITCGTGQCQNTVAACVNGVPNSCTPGNPGAEVCGNALDDDCDGMVDEAPCTCTMSLQCPSVPNGSGQCQAGNCTFTCDPGYLDCNALNGDGCEVGTTTDPNNCGGCGLVCPPSFPSCVGSVCQ